MLLELQNISKKYGTQPVLNNISFSLEKGEIVGFLGPNGAGKSTTLKIITGCLAADKGKVLIENTLIHPDATNVKSHIGFLPENNPLYEDMYVPEYLMYVAKIYKIKNPEEIIQQTILQTGLQPEKHKPIGKLSKGYRQRVGIAQAIIHNPVLVILDEPTSGLDPNQTDEINALLVSLSKEKGILFSSHTLSEVASVCTRIIIIHKGSIVANKLSNEISDLDALFKELTRQ